MSSAVNTSAVNTSTVKKSDVKTSAVTTFIYDNVDRTIYIIIVGVLLISLISVFKSPTWLLIIISLIFIFLYLLLDYIGAM